MSRRWPLLGLVMGLGACCSFNLDLGPSSSSSSSCDTVSPGLVFNTDGAATPDPCTSAGGTCETGSDAAAEASDAEDGADGEGGGGLCNQAPCAAGCTCEPASEDAGGGVCACPEAGQEAGADASEPPDAATTDAQAADGGDAGDQEAGEASTASTLCGVIWCAPGCLCMRSQDSECQCP